HHEFARPGLGRQRVLERQGPHLLRQVDGVAARRGPEGPAAAAELRRLAVAVAGTARTLLLHELLARARAFRAVLDVGRAGHRLELLVAHPAVQDVLAHLEAEDLVLEGDRAAGLAV